MPPRRRRAKAAAAGGAELAAARDALIPARVVPAVNPILPSGEIELPEYPLVAEQQHLEQRVLLLTSIQSLLRLSANQQTEAERLGFVSGEVDVGVIQTRVINVLEQLETRLRDVDRFFTFGGRLHPSGVVEVLTYPADEVDDSGSGTSSEGLPSYN